jgi:MFS family permease
MIPLSGASRSRVLLVLMSVTGLLFGVLGLLHQPLLAVLTIGAGGALLGMFSVHMTTILQTTSGSELRGRVMGLVMTIANAASPLGMVAGGIAGDLTDKNIPLIYQVCGAGIIASVVLIGRGRAVREYLAADGDR